MSRNEILGEIAAEFGEPSLMKHKHLVNWFEIPYLNGRRARAFYEYVFDIHYVLLFSFIRHCEERTK